MKDFKHHEKRQNDVAGTFLLESRVKTPGGNAFGQGFPVGYAVNGVETPEIVVTAGKTYEFEVLSACNHPFYLTTDPRGKGRDPYLEGWEGQPPTQRAEPICAGRKIKWTPPASAIGTELFYQCTVHDKMGWNVIVKAETLCEKYTDAFKQLGVIVNSNGLLSLIVTNAFEALTAPDSTLLEYFNGVVPSDSIDYTADDAGEEVAALAQGLVSFFGDALGCTDGSIPPYEGGSMAEVHKSMPISGFEYDEFVRILGEVLTAAGVETEDVTAIAGVLNATPLRAQICNFGSNCVESICSKYSDSSSMSGNEDLIRAITDEAFARVLADSQFVPFFDGTTPSGSTDFTMNAQATADLKTRFVAFMGRPDVLACPQDTFPQTDFQILDLKALHAAMPITPALFTAFNQHILDAVGKVATDASITLEAADVTAVQDLLNSLEPLLCNQPGCSTVAADVDQIFNVTVAQKANTHHFFGEGFGSAFQIDGADVEGINLEVGKTYSFRANQGCFHPFYFSTGTGAGSAEVETGVVSTLGENACNGKLFTFKPEASQVGQTIFYACRNHNKMGGRICVVNDASTAPPCLANVEPPVEDLSPCDQMAASVLAASGNTLNNQKEMLEKVVLDLFTFGAVTPPAPLKKYFDGTQPPGSTDFVGNQQAAGQLVAGLVKWFGTNLGCSDNSIDVYGPGEEQPNMKTVHQFMDITEPEFNAFNDKLVELLKNVGGTGAGLNMDNADKVRAFLDLTAPDICAGCDGFKKPTLCEKWAVALDISQVELVTTVVNGVAGKLFTDPLTKPFFNGQVPCNSRDFVGNLLNRAGLAKSLVAFFGSAGALGCSAAAFPVYRGETDMELVHRNMPITPEVFQVFVDAFEEVALGALQEKVPTAAADVAAVVALLNSPGIAIMCNQEGCDPKGEYVPKPGCDVVAPPTTATSPPDTTTTAVGDTTGTVDGTDVVEPTTTEQPNGEESTGEPTSASTLLLSTFAVTVTFLIHY